LLLLFVLLALFLPLEAYYLFLCFTLLGFEVLVALNSGIKIKGELLVDNSVHSISIGHISVQNGYLEQCEWGIVIIHRYGLQNLSVNGVTTAIGARDVGIVTLDGINDIGGDNKAISSGIEDEDLVIVSGECVIYLPSGT